MSTSSKHPAAQRCGQERDHTAGYPGIVAGTRILTADGIVPVELLGPGDRIITRNTGLVALTGLVFRQYQGDFLQARAGAFGDTRPATDTVLAADQTVLLRGAAAHVLCGQPSVLIRSGDLTPLDGCTLLRGIEMTVVRMVFDAPQLVYADGLETLCLPSQDHCLAA
ncbi:MAG: Hint domain-containing protein [Paracoccaceae bacterium]|nr:Hint domain-containing protein [Paracoccaceae bacterium]